MDLDNSSDFSVMDSTHVKPLDFTVPNVTDQTRTNVDELRSLLQQAYDFNMPELAKFIGEKLVVLTSDTDDIYQLAQCYYRFGEYERALEVLNKDALVNTAEKFRYLAGLCSLALGNTKDVLAYLGEQNPLRDTELKNTTGTSVRFDTAAMCLVRGKAYLLAQDDAKAKDCFMEALLIDAKCYDALSNLLEHNMLNEEEGWMFVQSLPYEEQCSELTTFFRYMYDMKVKRQLPEAMPAEMKLLESSIDIKLSKARILHQSNRLKECLQVCEEMKAQDPYFKEAIPLRLDCLYRLHKKTELYTYAKFLVDRMNRSELAWHAVGLYYLCVKNHSQAQTYFQKALTINRFFQQAWLGLGCAHAAENNYEQAINTYETCRSLIPNSHLPLMYLAEQHLERGELGLARDYFRQSLEKCNDDPYFYERYCSYLCRIGEYAEAHPTLHKALHHADNLKIDDDSLYERIWCHLGNVYQQPPHQNYVRALECCRNALERNPRSSEAHTLRGKSYYAQGDYGKAIYEYYEALRCPVKGSLKVQKLLDQALKRHAKSSFIERAFVNSRSDLFVADSKYDIDDEAVAVDSSKNQKNKN